MHPKDGRRLSDGEDTGRPGDAGSERRDGCEV
jgi:hypothetical protein